MALIVEDGTGKADAESYISVADATTYHANRGNSAWASIATDAVREQHLRRATDYMMQTYRGRWKGQRINSSQALDWPRAWVKRDDYYSSADADANGDFYYPSNSVPREVANACADLALRSISGELLADQAQGVKEKTVGPITIVYDEASPQTKKYPAIDRALQPYLSGSGGNVRLVRA